MIVVVVVVVMVLFMRAVFVSYVNVIHVANATSRDVLGASDVIALIHSRCIFWAGSMRDSGMDPRVLGTVGSRPACVCLGSM